MKFSICVEHTACPHPGDPARRLCYYLIPLPIRTQTAYSLLVCEEEDGGILESRLLCDLTREEAQARELLRLCTEGTVLPREAEEVLAEAMAR